MKLFTSTFVFSLFLYGIQGKLLDSFAESAESDSSSRAEDDDVQCPKGTFLFDIDGECHPCSQCGPDLYVLEQCTPETDTICDWCFSPLAVKNDDFKRSCGNADVKAFFKIVIRARKDEQLQDDSHGVFTFEEERMKEARRWAVAANITKFGFYFFLVMLIVSVIRYVRKSNKAYRTITVTPPMLDEHDNSNIIRAANHISDKLRKKGYDRLEEFV